MTTERPTMPPTSPEIDAELTLKPCPFCGANAAIYLSDREGIMCRNGHIFAGQYGYVGNREKAIAEWNCRAPSQADEIVVLRAEIATLRAERAQWTTFPVNRATGAAPAVTPGVTLIAR